MFFYAMNLSNIHKNDDLIDKSDNFWKICSWNNYYVWNKHHETILKEFIDYDYANILIVEPIPFVDSSYDFKSKIDDKNINIAIFDLSPHRRSVSMYFNWDDEFFNSHVIKRFYKDIIEITFKKINLLIKSKRAFSNELLDKDYVNFMKSIKENRNIKIIDPDCSIFRLAKYCEASISFPFTSPAQIFKHTGKTSFYYDPINYFKKSHLGKRGIDIYNKKDLKNWIDEITK